MHGHRHAVAIALLLAAPRLFAACEETLRPALVRELTAPALKYAGSVAWLDDEAVAIGAAGGVFEYTLADGALRNLVPSRPIPHGLGNVEDVASDGRTLVAFNDDYSDLAYDLTSAKLVSAQRGPAFEVIDLAVRDDTLVLLGFPAVAKLEEGGALWIAKLGAKRDAFRLLHQVDDEAVENLRSCLPPFGGATLVQEDGTIAMITAAEPGVRRFRPDGTPLPTLGAGLHELVVPRIHEVRQYAADIMRRYRVLNAQPIGVDLIETSHGLAIVVRRVSKATVWWELWFPGPGGGTRRRIRLAAQDERVIGGHMRCDARGSRVACMFGKAVQPSGFGGERPHLLLFDLGDVTRKGACGS